ncbi:MAG: ADP-ribosylglycohydrolase family protein [Deltaproteobacteria bacterium]|jgi:ADP-ribosylglycohydrolase|nr:ADP-ribosylglycohydrolase family protein [Deltaproteobacteria bacterium]
MTVLGVEMAESFSKSLSEKHSGAFLGLASGDALGWPNEQVWGGKVDPFVTSHQQLLFRSWLKRSGGSYYAHDRLILPGQYSDRTQLALCQARSLTYGQKWLKRFSFIELPFWHLYDRSGNLTNKEAAREWADQIPTWSGLRRPFELVKFFEAKDNGILSRIQPLVIARADDEDFTDLALDIISAGSVTHGHPGALIGALAYGFAAWQAQNQGLMGTDIILSLLDSFNKWSVIPNNVDASDPMFKAATTRQPDYRNLWRHMAQEMAVSLNQAKKELTRQSVNQDDVFIRAMDGFDKKKGRQALNTVAMSLFLAARYTQDPVTGLKKASQMIGIDTTTVAALTGSLLGAFHGPGFLEPLVDRLQDAKYIIKLTSALKQKDDRGDNYNGPEFDLKYLNNWRDELSGLSQGDSKALPDGRSARVVSREDMMTINKQFNIIIHNLQTDDGQNLSFTKIRKLPELKKHKPGLTAAETSN